MNARTPGLFLLQRPVLLYALIGVYLPLYFIDDRWLLLPLALVPLVIPPLLCYEVVSSIHGGFAQGGADDVLVLPVCSSRLAGAFFSTFLRRAMVLFPLYAAAGLFCFFGLGSMESWEDPRLVALTTGFVLLSTLLHITCFVAAACYASTAGSNTALQAVLAMAATYAGRWIGGMGSLFVALVGMGTFSDIDPTEGLSPVGKRLLFAASQLPALLILVIFFYSRFRSAVWDLWRNGGDETEPLAERPRGYRLPSPRKHEWPLLEHELSRLGRKPWAYWLRIVPAGLAAISAFGVVKAFVDTSAAFGLAGRFGDMLATQSAVLQYACAFLLPPLITAGAIAEEKREGTLDLLILADRSASEVYWAKFAAAYIVVMTLLLTTLPLLATAAVLGGVEVGQAALRLGALGLCVAACCAIGMLCSTLARHAIGAFLVSSMACIGLFVLAFGLEWPRVDASITVIVAALLALAASWMAIRLLPRQIGRSTTHPDGESPWLQSPLTGLPDRLLDRWLPQTADLRIADAATPGLRLLRRPWTAQLLFLAAIAFWFAPVGAFAMACVLLVLVSYEVTASLAPARTEGALDDLLVTPLDAQDLARPLYHAYLRRTLLLAPALWTAECVCVLSILSLYPWSSVAAVGVAAVLAPVAVTQVMFITGISCSQGAESPKPLKQTVQALFGFILLSAISGLLAFTLALVAWVVLATPLAALGFSGPSMTAWTFLMVITVLSAGQVTFLLGFRGSCLSDFRRHLRPGVS